MTNPLIFSDYLKPIAAEERRIEEEEKKIRDEQKRIAKALEEGMVFTPSRQNIQCLKLARSPDDLTCLLSVLLSQQMKTAFSSKCFEDVLVPLK